MFYVEHTGHPFAKGYADFKTLDAAMNHARLSCSDAIETRVYGNSHNLIATFGQNGVMK